MTEINKPPRCKKCGKILKRKSGAYGGLCREHAKERADEYHSKATYDPWLRP